MLTPQALLLIDGLINLCGGLALAGCLLLGGLALEARGALLLWALVLLVGISPVELCSLRRGLEREPRL